MWSFTINLKYLHFCACQWECIIGVLLCKPFVREIHSFGFLSLHSWHDCRREEAAKTLYMGHILNAHKLVVVCQVRRYLMEQQKSLDEYISAKVVDESSGVNTKMSKSLPWCFWEGLLCYDRCTQYFGGETFTTWKPFKSQFACWG